MKSELEKMNKNIELLLKTVTTETTTNNLKMNSDDESAILYDCTNSYLKPTTPDEISYKDKLEVATKELELVFAEKEKLLNW